MIEKYRNRLKEIIEMSFQTLEMKLSNGGTKKNLSNSCTIQNLFAKFA